jgi:hypothetical protein
MFSGGPGGGFGGPGGFGGGAAITSPTTAATNLTAQFQAEAAETGLAESVIVAGWSQGQSLEQIAEANGISATQLQTDIKNYAQSQENAELQALVTNGTITQAQMNARLQFEATQAAKMQTAMSNASGTWPGGPRGGFGRMMGHRPTSTVGTSSGN